MTKPHRIVLSRSASEEFATIVPQIPVYDDGGTTTVEKAKVKKKTKEDVNKWTITPAPYKDVSTLMQNYLMLSKARLTSECRVLLLLKNQFNFPLHHTGLVVITSMAGYAMAPAPFVASTFVLCAIGTGLCSAAANSINQYHEVPFDAQMSRTKNRVLVRGQVSPLHSIGFAIGAAGTGICMLYYGVNGMTALLGASNLVLYTMIYTPMKRYSILNTWVGSIGKFFRFYFVNNK